MLYKALKLAHVRSCFSLRRSVHLVARASDSTARGGAVHLGIAIRLLARTARDGALDLVVGTADAVAHGGLDTGCGASNGEDGRALRAAVAAAKKTTATGSAGRRASCADLCARRADLAVEEAGTGAASSFCGGDTGCSAAETVMAVMVMMAARGGAGSAGVGRQEAASRAGLRGRVVPMHFEG